MFEPEARVQILRHRGQPAREIRSDKGERAPGKCERGGEQREYGEHAHAANIVVQLNVVS